MVTRETVFINLIRALHIAVSACLSAMLVYLANAFLGGPDGFGILSSWSLMHGAIFFVIPVVIGLAWLLYALLKPASIRLQSLFSRDGEIQSWRLSVLAVLSLVFAILGFGIPLFFSPVAVILGHMAWKRCRNQINLGGSAIALSGLILGYLGLALSAYVVAAFIYIAVKS